MSVNVNFAAVPATRAERPTGAARIILPYDVLVSLQGRRVTVFLSVRNEELEGTLRTVDSDRGDVFLEQVVHYRWCAVSDDVKGASSSAPGPAAADGGATSDKTPACTPCRGGGVRRELRRCAAATVNHRYIALIAPALAADT